ncbi:FAD-dependent oxidoreductase [Crossiella cryophila]|uniref:Isorenieratene synthase n=1 Tax=Crossiella cryophila TaxID=43355 RepID=A0A7W7CBC9_9PSEU|nr:FAD-dependent oxidoreductase [Crossiella cryophila]MBB4678011.1 isorenieratene synthase [Crossiella cryophila]
MIPLGTDRRAVKHLPRGTRPDVSHLSAPPRVVVIGGGIAGLAAATALSDRGVEVVLLEREDYLGGRVGGWPVTLSDGSRVTMTRGFHAFFRQYYNLRQLLRRADPDLRALTPLTDYPLLHSNGHADTFAGLPRTPPLNAAAFVLRSPTFSWAELSTVDARRAMTLLDVRVPETYAELDHLDAVEFLDRIGFPAAARDLAFEVFSRSFFSDPRLLSAAELAVMFHIYFLGSSEGLVFDVAADPFPHGLWEPLGRYLSGRGVEIRTGVRVGAVEPSARRRYAVHLADALAPLEADAVVLATDVGGLRTIVGDSPGIATADWRGAVSRLRTAPRFGVLRLWLDRPVRADRAGFLGTAGFGPLDNISVLDRYEHQARDWAARRDGSVVELHAYALPVDAVLGDVRAELLAQLGKVYPETVDARIVDERFEIRSDCPLFLPGTYQDRLEVRTPEDYLVVAGDHVRTGLPVALMERAATAGFQAANALLGNWDVQGRTLWTVPTQGRSPLLRTIARRLR